MTTIAEALASAIVQLSDSDSSRLDAEVLIAHVLNKSRGYLRAYPEQSLTSEQLDAFTECIKRRADGEPIAYITGVREFWSLEFAVNESTLIPRPETECLVEQLLNALPKDESCQVADLGTGSGAIAISVARERPNWRVFATDLSEPALDVARANAAKHSVTNVQFLHGAWCAPLAAEKFHAIVSNPPYLAATDTHLKEGDLRFEPHTALVADENGFADIINIATQAYEYLYSSGWLMIEHGYDQATECRALITQLGYAGVQSVNDLAGIERLVVAQKS